MEERGRRRCRRAERTKQQEYSFTGAIGAARGDSRPADVGGYQVKSQLATCGLRNSENPTSDNLKPQETRNQDSDDMGLDGTELSYPGSSVVADEKS
jgi:hypothetical protein